MTLAHCCRFLSVSGLQQVFPVTVNVCSCEGEIRPSLSHFALQDKYENVTSAETLAALLPVEKYMQDYEILKIYDDSQLNELAPSLKISMLGDKIVTSSADSKENDSRQEIERTNSIESPSQLKKSKRPKRTPKAEGQKEIKRNETRLKMKSASNTESQQQSPKKQVMGSPKGSSNQSSKVNMEAVAGLANLTDSPMQSALSDHTKQPTKVPKLAQRGSKSLLIPHLKYVLLAHLFPFALQKPSSLSIRKQQP